MADEVSGSYEPPILLMQIADDELIRVICDDYGATTFDGLTWYEAENEEFYIHLNTNPARRNNPEGAKGRFTLAHELGHYFIDRHRRGLMSGELKPHGSVNYLTNQSAWQLEREADAFASALLMPSASVKAFVGRTPFSFAVIEAIADKYKVNKSAAAIRFAEIGNTPIMVVYAVDGKIRWVNKSEDFPFWKLRHGSGKGDKVPVNTVMGTYFYEHDRDDCRKDELVYAEDWFDTRFEEDNDKEFTEWCIEYQNSALSVLWER